MATMTKTIAGSFVALAMIFSLPAIADPIKGSSKGLSTHTHPIIEQDEQYPFNREDTIYLYSYCDESHSQVLLTFLDSDLLPGGSYPSSCGEDSIYTIVHRYYCPALFEFGQYIIVYHSFYKGGGIGDIFPIDCFS